MRARQPVVLLLALFLVLAGSLAAQEAATDSTRSAPADLQVRNQSFDEVRVEVRRAVEGSCERGVTLTTRSIGRGTALSFRSSHELCIRRELNPGARDGRWTAWQKREPAAAEVTL